VQQTTYNHQLAPMLKQTEQNNYKIELLLVITSCNYQGAGSESEHAEGTGNEYRHAV
jgi:hypothetical protein